MRKYCATHFAKMAHFPPGPCGLNNFTEVGYAANSETNHKERAQRAIGRRHVEVFSHSISGAHRDLRTGRAIIGPWTGIALTLQRISGALPPPGQAASSLRPDFLKLGKEYEVCSLVRILNEIEQLLGV